MRCGYGLGAGLLAGCLVGLAEAVFVLSQASTGEYTALLHAALIYGVLGGGLGLAPGALLAALGGRVRVALGWTLSFVAVSLTFGVAVGRHWLALLRLREHPVPVAWDVALGGGSVVLAVLGTWLGVVFLTRTPLKVLPRAKGTAAALGALVGLAVLFAFAPGPRGQGHTLVPDRPTDVDGDDIIVVVISGLRADAVGDTTPTLDGLARQGVSFDSAVAQASWTGGAMATILAGAGPARHGVLGRADRLDARQDTLAEVIAAAGYATGAVINSAEAGRATGMQQGFDWFRFVPPGALAPLVPGLRSEGSLHLSLVSLLSARWGGSVGYRSSEAVLDDGLLFVEANREAGHRFFLLVHLVVPAPPRGGDGEERYLSEVHRADAALGGFFERLAALGTWERTTVVVTADHGEELGEHGGWGHGSSLYEEVVHIPLIVRVAGAEIAGARVPWVVRQADIAPTVVARIGVTAPEEWEGVDVLDGRAAGLLEDLAAGEGSALDEAPVLEAVLFQDIGGAVLSGIRAGEWKYLRANPANPRGLPAEQLFDLSRDPAEEQDQAGREGARQAELSRRLREALGGRAAPR